MGCFSAHVLYSFVGKCAGNSSTWANCVERNLRFTSGWVIQYKASLLASFSRCLCKVQACEPRSTVFIDVKQSCESDFPTCSILLFFRFTDWIFSECVGTQMHLEKTALEKKRSYCRSSWFLRSRDLEVVWILFRCF